MGVFRRKVPTHYVPVHPDNIGKNDWIVLLEAGTIVSPSDEKLRVAKATLERKIVTKYNILLRPKHFLVLEGYDPRIHTLYFCPQLYAYDSDNKLVALEGEEIGKLLAQAVQHGVVERQPWYEPSDKVPNQPINPVSVPHPDSCSAQKRTRYGRSLLCASRIFALPQPGRPSSGATSQAPPQGALRREPRACCRSWRCRRATCPRDRRNSGRNPNRA